MTKETRRTAVAAFEHLTGSGRGQIDWAVKAKTDVLLSPEGVLTMAPGGDGASDTRIAVIRRSKDGFHLHVDMGMQIWLNGWPIEHHLLANGDVIEFCNSGPIAKVSLYRQGERRPHNVSAIFRNALAYLQASRRPWPARFGRGLQGLLVDLLRETALVFRAFVLLALAAIAAVVYLQSEREQRLSERITSEALRMESFAAALAKTQEAALTDADLHALRQDIMDERAAALQQLSRAGAEVIAAARPSVIFLQFSYGFRDAATGRMLRHLTDAEGRVIRMPHGVPRLTLDGDSRVASKEVMGTGFVVGKNGLIATNRHVALPWEIDPASQILIRQGLEPVVLRFIAWLPGAPTSIPVILAAASKQVDLAVLKAADAAMPIAAPGLVISETTPAPGTTAILLGYPTGMRILLAQAGEPFVETLQAEGVADFWTIAERLAAAGRIEPLASRGIIGQATLAAIIYDAETTHGGSGGPVLNAAGRVVAINTAILPEYGGSNLGVPARLLRELLETIE